MHVYLPLSPPPLTLSLPVGALTVLRGNRAQRRRGGQRERHRGLARAAPVDHGRGQTGQNRSNAWSTLRGTPPSLYSELPRPRDTLLPGPHGGPRGVDAPADSERGLPEKRGVDNRHRPSPGGAHSLRRPRALWDPALSGSSPTLLKKGCVIGSITFGSISLGPIAQLSDLSVSCRCLISARVLQSAFSAHPLCRPRALWDPPPL